jgi:hypothetical protein
MSKAVRPGRGFVAPGRRLGVRAAGNGLTTALYCGNLEAVN